MNEAVSAAFLEKGSLHLDVPMEEWEGKLDGGNKLNRLNKRSETKGWVLRYLVNIWHVLPHAEVVLDAQLLIIKDYQLVLLRRWMVMDEGVQLTDLVFEDIE